MFKGSSDWVFIIWLGEKKKIDILALSFYRFLGLPYNTGTYFFCVARY